MERRGGWFATRCTGCLEHHGNREREGLREVEVQGLHLFQQHFNYFVCRRLVKQMHSGDPATTGRNPMRIWSLSFFFVVVVFVFQPTSSSHICEITITIGYTEALQKEADKKRGRQIWGEGEERKSKSVKKDK